MKSLIFILCFLAGSMAIAQTWTNTIDGFFETNFGIGIGGKTRLANIDSQVAGIINFGNGTPADRSAIGLFGYVDTSVLFSSNGHNGMTGSIGCHITTILVRNSAGTGTQSLSYCDSLTNNTVYGGIVAP